jgi:hypothetical protein
MERLEPGTYALGPSGSLIDAGSFERAARRPFGE